jgi:hypothetical protein
MLALFMDDEKKLDDCQFDLWSSPTWPHEPLCMTSFDAAAAWTRSRAASPCCPSSSRGTSWSLPTSATLGLFWASHPTTTLSRRRAHRPSEA